MSRKNTWHKKIKHEARRQKQIIEEKLHEKSGKKKNHKSKKCSFRLKQSDSRSEYAEMNISKLHHR